MSRDLDGRVAIVTGAGKGLGRAYALELARRGACLVINNRRHAGETDGDTSAQRTVEAIRAAGGYAVPNWDDVRDPASGTRMVARALAEFGRVDIAIANAGIAQAQAFHKLALEDFRSAFDTSFFGNLHLAHAAWPRLREQGGGCLILTASTAGLFGNHGMTAYASAKAAVIGLMRALAVEGPAHGVRVNVVAPYAYSQMTAPYMDEAARARFDPALVAPLVADLARDDCRLNGEVLVCGGGILRRAQTTESDGAPFRPGAPDAQVEHLRGLAHRAYPHANDAFAALLREAVRQQ
ncbi:MAG: SDR family NAD(P)-dependent oxidoreductase [Burkholderiales bacterium]|nr:SDR family NAD(P)-dependent oxidoreductase [Burkholderiales bacterium]